jgi:hypothetical protein
MEKDKQQRIRELAEQMQHATNPDQQNLAQGTLELLEYVDELVLALHSATETCCEAMSLVYEGRCKGT